MIIRDFQPEDQNDARALVLSGLSEHFGTIDETLNPDLDDIQAYFINQGHIFLVAEEMGRLVGTVGLLLEKPKRSRIVRMSVLKEQRRKGIAQVLMSRIFEINKRLGTTEILVFTEPHWQEAVSFYNQIGFIPYGRDEIDIHMKMEIEQKNRHAIKTI